MAIYGLGGRARRLLSKTTLCKVDFHSLQPMWSARITRRNRLETAEFRDQLILDQMILTPLVSETFHVEMGQKKPAPINPIATMPNQNRDGAPADLEAHPAGTLLRRARIDELEKTMSKIWKPLVLALVAPSLFVGCMNMPTPTSQITGAYTSTLRYEDFDCSQLAIEMASLARRENQLVVAQRQRIKTSEVQAFWWGYGQGDGIEASELANVRGEREAVRTAIDTKDCATLSAKRTNQTQNRTSTGSGELH